MKKLMKRIMNWFGNIFGYDIVILRKHNIMPNGGVRINIGAGDWGRKGWINLDYPSEHYANVQKKHPFIAYDIRGGGKMPFGDNSIEAIYCSHVIEHIENNYVSALFHEYYRVLGDGGVLRIACPDAEFLYHVSKCGMGYWEWRKKWFEEKEVSFDMVRPVDCLVSEIATPKLIRLGWMNNTEDYEKEFLAMDMENFLAFICEDIPYNVKYVESHINYWTFSKAAEYLKKAGFKYVIRSKYGASSYYEMQDKTAFDTTHPEMSLYIEAIK